MCVFDVKYLSTGARRKHDGAYIQGFNGAVQSVEGQRAHTRETELKREIEPYDKQTRPLSFWSSDETTNNFSLLHHVRQLFSICSINIHEMYQTLDCEVRDMRTGGSCHFNGNTFI